MFVVHGTKKFLDRVKQPPAAVIPEPTTALGNWYATVLFWRPQAVLAVNEPTLLPVLLALAPAATVLERLPAAVATVLKAHRINEAFIDTEISEMAQCQLTKTANRSVLGVMNEFAYLSSVYRQDRHQHDLLDLSLRLAHVPCGPLDNSHLSPDRELVAHIAQHS
jgi:hypothetical protein